MKALETHMFGLCLNDLSANDVLLAMELLQGIETFPATLYGDGRRSEIAKYFIEMARDKLLAA